MSFRLRLCNTQYDAHLVPYKQLTILTSYDIMSYALFSLVSSLTKERTIRYLMLYLFVFSFVGGGRLCVPFCAWRFCYICFLNSKYYFIILYMSRLDFLFDFKSILVYYKLFLKILVIYNVTCLIYLIFSKIVSF